MAVDDILAFPCLRPLRIESDRGQAGACAGEEACCGVHSGLPDSVGNSPNVPATAARVPSRPTSVDALIASSVDYMLYAEPSIRSLHVAAELGDVEAVTSFLKAGVPVDLPRAMDGDTPLMLAARFGHQAVCEALLVEGAMPNARNAIQNGPLHEAARNGRVVCCQLLLSAGADVNMQGENGWTALHEAARWGHAVVVRLLLASGASHSLAAAFDDTPLHLAVDRGYSAVCRLLVHSGALPRQLSPKRKYDGQQQAFRNGRWLSSGPAKRVSL
eukprot:SM000065S20238  [mRNA]  locus=s65:596544:598708:+ [translate_table: standard]